MRGSAGSRRSIPACAGKPQLASKVACALGRSASRSVYPRVCGETAVRVDPDVTLGAPGLSPRVRGNRYHGPIAWACSDGRVYPRVCGETLSSESVRPVQSEVYPRVCGETPTGYHRGAPRAFTVYPRVCGETSGQRLSLRNPPAIMGSIPACAGKPGEGAPGNPGVRGNHLKYPSCPGSIPACAGKPPQRSGVTCLGSIPACAGKPSIGL